MTDFLRLSRKHTRSKTQVSSRYQRLGRTTRGPRSGPFLHVRRLRVIGDTLWKTKRFTFFYDQVRVSTHTSEARSRKTHELN